MITAVAKVLRGLQAPSGLFLASHSDVSTGYNKAWLRDNIYEAMGLEKLQDIESVKRTYAALFDVLKKYEYKIDYAISEKPDAAFKYIHARFHPETYEEFYEDWGNKQNDAVGAFLFKVGDLFEKGIVVFRDSDDLRILQKLVHYLASIEYWQDEDNGVWEENEEVHASSVGACVAGLKKISKIVDVNPRLIALGAQTLKVLLPRESETKEVDLALLSLIYPYNVVDKRTKYLILKNVEEQLVRDKGVIRYIGDAYYSSEDGEAEWCFGFPWLAKIYKDMGDMKKYEYYMDKTHTTMTKDFEIPELYYAKTNEPNENTPLGWSHAMYLIAQG